MDIREIQEQYAEYDQLSREEAIEELVSDFPRLFLKDTSLFRSFAIDNRSAARKLLDSFKEIFARIKSKITGKPRNMGKTLGELQEALNLWEQAMEEAKQTVKDIRKGKKEAPSQQAEGGKRKYSLNQYSEHQKNNWATSKRIVIYENAGQLLEFINNAIVDSTPNQKMYFGAISSDLAREIFLKTGLNVENYNLSLGAYEIRKILNNHGKDSTEAPRGQRPVVPDDFAHIVDVVTNPDNIVLSPNTYMGKPAIIFSGNHNGKMNVVAVVSDKRLDLFVQTVYVNIKNGNLPMPTGEQAPVNTPKANNGTVSITRVPQSQTNVKRKNSINELTDEGLTMTYVRVPNQNTQNYGSTYGQNIEPSGEYMSMDTTQGKHKIEGYEYGTIQFKKPLVLEHINTSDTGWKKTVSDMYNGLTGKKLTAALIKDGYDAIVTYDEYGYSEIVNLNGTKLNGDSKRKNSISPFDDDITADIFDVLEDNEAVVSIENQLREQLQYFQKQIKVTKDATADPKSVQKIAKKIVKDYGSAVDVEDILFDLQKVYDRMYRGEGYPDYIGDVEAIARKIAEQMTETENDLYAEYREARKVLRDTYIYVPEGLRSELPDYYDTKRAGNSACS